MALLVCIIVCIRRKRSDLWPYLIKSLSLKTCFFYFFITLWPYLSCDCLYKKEKIWTVFKGILVMFLYSLILLGTTHQSQTHPPSSTAWPVWHIAGWCKRDESIQNQLEWPNFLEPFGLRWPLRINIPIQMKIHKIWIGIKNQEVSWPST